MFLLLFLGSISFGLLTGEFVGFALCSGFIAGLPLSLLLLLLLLAVELFLLANHPIMVAFQVLVVLIFVVVLVVLLSQAILSVFEVVDLCIDFLPFGIKNRVGLVLVVFVLRQVLQVIVVALGLFDFVIELLDVLVSGIHELAVLPHLFVHDLLFLLELFQRLGVGEAPLILMDLVHDLLFVVGRQLVVLKGVLQLGKLRLDGVVVIEGFELLSDLLPLVVEVVASLLHLIVLVLEFLEFFSLLLDELDLLSDHLAERDHFVLLLFFVALSLLLLSFFQVLLEAFLESQKRCTNWSRALSMSASILSSLEKNSSLLGFSIGFLGSSGTLVSKVILLLSQSNSGRTRSRGGLLGFYGFSWPWVAPSPPISCFSYSCPSSPLTMYCTLGPLGSLLRSFLSFPPFSRFGF